MYGAELQCEHVGGHLFKVGDWNYDFVLELAKQRLPDNGNFTWTKYPKADNDVRIKSDIGECTILNLDDGKVREINCSEKRGDFICTKSL